MPHGALSQINCLLTINSLQNSSEFELVFQILKLDYTNFELLQSKLLHHRLAAWCRPGPPPLAYSGHRASPRRRPSPRPVRPPPRFAAVAHRPALAATVPARAAGRHLDPLPPHRHHAGPCSRLPPRSAVDSPPPCRPQAADMPHHRHMLFVESRKSFEARRAKKKRFFTSVTKNTQ